MTNLANITLSQLEAERYNAEMAARPMVEETPAIVLDRILVMLSNADLDRAAGRYASAAQFEAQARELARNFKAGA